MIVLKLILKKINCCLKIQIIFKMCMNQNGTLDYSEGFSYKIKDAAVVSMNSRV